MYSYICLYKGNNCWISHLTF